MIESWIDSVAHKTLSKVNSKLNLKLKSKANAKKTVTLSAPVPAAGSLGFLHVFGSKKEALLKKLVQEKSPGWQQQSLLKNGAPLVHFAGSDGFYWLVGPGIFGGSKNQTGQSGGKYGFYRDLAGSALGHIRSQKINHLEIHFYGLSLQEELGFLVGLDVGAYNYKKSLTEKPYEDLPQFQIFGGQVPVAEAASVSCAVNLARHLVNLPPNLLNPVSYAKCVQGLGFSSAMKVDVWDEKKMKAEKMNLHLAVNAGSATPPRLVHLKYRPKKKTSRAPIAFVGKGLTFDTGGLDIKPSAGMRLMKKDMGGSAAVIAVAKWVDDSAYPHACDFYLGLAENSVDSLSFRPSDVIESRGGYKVEIDNTDAEGRLVLADVLDVAATQKGADEPEWIIDVATLTGAIKVALGADVAGLFSNDDRLAGELVKAGDQVDDLSWRMPLVHKYFANLSSPFADFKNSADGFGGAITAALFLEKFIRAKKWAHLDIYAWTDKPSGALSTAGGNGQAVQALIQFLKNRA